MEQTAKFKLNQWEKTDRIQMEDFNADNAKLETALSKCGNCRMVTSSYTGNGKYGSITPNQVTFDKAPDSVFVSGGTSLLLAFRGINQAYLLTGSSVLTLPATWSGNGVSWYHSENPAHQMNTQNAVYTYCALIRADT